ncbi:MAG TPA: PIG-L family deacetylase [Thermoanaerobaculia bacterium]|jgi:LmbE family N-acetylglucosaminyl deacetylase|nr:PIG-L family deacetylase [Thermoanaerobaculia bacterium]
MRSRDFRLPLPAATLLLLLALSAAAQTPAPAPASPSPAAAPWPKVLLVTAHPDDDSLFGGTVYKITHQLGGKVDLFVVTNGEGGFHYSTLSESIYGLKLSDEKVGREYLPGIRKRELLAGGKIVGIRNYFFLDQQDKEYTQDVGVVFQGDLWNLDLVRGRLRAVLEQNRYDFVFVMLPTPTTHAHHAAAAILALQVIASLPAGGRPVVLGGGGYKRNEPPRPAFTGREGYPVTKIREGAPPFEFDRTQKFGWKDQLDYNIVVNWQIAEHKSQGVMQLGMNRLDVEQYWYFDLNGEAGLKAARTLFDRLKTAPNPS